MKYKPGCTPVQAVGYLKEALGAAEYAHHCAVLWFSEIMRRKLYRQLGYSSMGQFAAVELKFSRTRIGNFLHLSSKLNELPKLRASMAAGRVGYTKALEVIKVATPANEDQWVTLAEIQSRTVLRGTVKKAQELAKRRRRARAIRGDEQNRGKDPDARTPTSPLNDPQGADPHQPAAFAGNLDQGDQGERSSPSSPNTSVEVESLPVEEIPVRLYVEFDPEQWARFEALEEKLRQQGHMTGRQAKAQLLVDALEALVEKGNRPLNSESDCEEKDSGKKARRRATLLPGSPVQIHVHHCPECGQSKVSTNRGELDLSPTTFQRLSCNAQVQEPGQPNRSTIPPSTHRLVLARDRHRCQAPGCNNTHHLEVHHVQPRSEGGSNRMENLTTLCRACHQMWHERGGPPEGWKQPLKAKTK